VSKDSRAGVWETVILNEDGSIEVELKVIREDQKTVYGIEMVQPGTAKYGEVIARHPNLKPGHSHQIEIETNSDW
jgi:hypothetical protein